MDISDLVEKLGRVTSLAGGVRQALRILLLVDVVAAVAVVIGLVLLGLTGGWFVLALLFGLAALAPGLFVWRGMGMFEQIELLPETLVDIGQLPERALRDVREVIETAVSPRGVRGAIWEAGSLVRELMSVLPIVDFVKSFNPLSVAVTAGAAAAVPVVAFLGALAVVLGLIY